MDTSPFDIIKKKESVSICSMNSRTMSASKVFVDYLAKTISFCCLQSFFINPRFRN